MDAWWRHQPPPVGFDTWEEALAAWDVPEDRWDSASAVVDPDGVLPRIFFQRVPESKSTKNRVHLDVRAWSGEERPPPDEHRRLVDTKVKQLVDAGARIAGPAAEFGTSWMVMQDPEGNEFCVT